MLFDSHAHINEASYSPGSGRTDQDQRKRPMMHVAHIGYESASSKLAVETRSQISVGPMTCELRISTQMPTRLTMELAMYKGLARKKKVVAIGEIGIGFPL